MKYLILIAALVLVAVTVNALASSRLPKPIGDLKALEAAIEMYHLERRDWPSTLDDLVTHGYVRKMLLDPWGRAYNYSLKAPLPELPQRHVYLWSLGRDGNWGGTGVDKDWLLWELE